MNNLWDEKEAGVFAARSARHTGEGLALLLYATQLVGRNPRLAMHGGGNTSLKTKVKTRTGQEKEALFVKASGVDMAEITTEGFVCLDLESLRGLRRLKGLTDEEMADEFRIHLLRPSAGLPSIETPMHAFLAAPVVIHTHPSAVLALTNRRDSAEALQEAFGGEAAVVPYASSGLELGLAVAETVEGTPCRAVVVMHHGLVTWGEEPKAAYDRTIEMVTLAQEYLRKARRSFVFAEMKIDVAQARERYVKLAPVIRGLLSPPTGDPDHPFRRGILLPLTTADTLEFLASPFAKVLADTSPLTPDYLVWTKAYPLYAEGLAYDDPALFRQGLAAALGSFRTRYEAYVKENAHLLPGFNASAVDFLPRVLFLPGLGAFCSAATLGAARIVRDITEQLISVRRKISETGGIYRGLAEDHLFEMEFRALQRAKDLKPQGQPLAGSVALVTGAAGAIGSGICEALLEAGCAVAATDVAEEPLAGLKERLGRHGGLLEAIPLDVTDKASVAEGFAKAIEAFGGIDIVVINAGLALVSPLAQMDLEAFRALERVNVEGTVLMLSEAARTFAEQGTGGDVVLISTKNVFAPGASFGAYSATKAAAHQLGRVAALEMAELGVRVNMVAPDAVFACGETPSGLWAKIGPERMKARGLDEKGLKEYYRQRNLLKAEIKAEHVARAVLFFVTRQTPTTGATLPVDGGLPEASPR